MNKIIKQQKEKCGEEAQTELSHEAYEILGFLNTTKADNSDTVGTVRKE